MPIRKVPSRNFTRSIGVALCLATAGLGPAGQAQTAGLLSRVQVVSGAANTCPALFIGFGTRLGFTRQQIEDGGRTLALWFSRDPGDGGTGPSAELIETYPNIDLPGLGTVRVSLETNGATPVLRLRFDRPVSASVAQGGESSVVITNLGPVGVSCSAPTPKNAGNADVAGGGSETEVNLAEARRLITAGQYPRAVQLLTKVLSQTENDGSPEAQEMLGIARERAGQMAHARAEYRTYLEDYPEGPGADRVRQRLAAILSAQSAPRIAGQPSAGTSPAATTLASTAALPPATPRSRKVAKSPKTTDKPADPTFRGRVSSYYMRNQGSTFFFEFDTGTTDEDSDVFQNTLITTVDLEGSSETRKTRKSWRFATDHEAEFLGPFEQSTSVSRVYYDIEGKNSGAGIRFGRQTRNDGGIFGRFDGIQVRYPVGERVKLRSVLGSPADSSSDGVFESSKLLFGTSAKVEDLSHGLDASLYVVGQTREGFVDRTAVGVDLQRQTQTSSIVALVDYDTYFQTLNLARISGTWLGANRTSFSITADYTHSPLLTLGNALTGQTVTTLEDLSATNSTAAMKQLALDRTSATKSVTLAYSKPISEKWQVSVDGTVFTTGATPASGGVAATPATGPEYFTSIQFVGSNVMRERDTVSLSARYADAETSDLLLLDGYVRFETAGSLRLKPRLRIGYRVFAAGGEELFAIPSLNGTYKLGKQTEFELEIGGRVSTLSAPTYSEEANELYITAGINRQF